jgi:hypothetical protein
MASARQEVVMSKGKAIGARSKAACEQSELEKKMPQSTLELLRRHAERFRRAIEACDRSLLPIGFQEFPVGAGDANLLLGNYLTEQGLGDFEYVVGEAGNREEDPETYTTHSWIRQGCIDIDIIADQFVTSEESVVVTEDSSWHSGFRKGVPGVADYRIYDEPFRSELEAAYRQILAVLKTFPAP